MGGEDRTHTHALVLVILINKDVIEDEAEQLILQCAVRIKHQRLQGLSAPCGQLVTEDHQQVTQQHERLSTHNKAM